MTLLEVLLFVFGLASISGILTHREEKIRVHRWRESRKLECTEWEKKYPNDWQTRTNFCDERFGYPRQWWEPKTYQELLNER